MIEWKCGMQDAGNEIWDVRNGKSDVGNEDFECLHPISHFLHDILIKKNWIGSREMGNGIQMRILVTEVLPSEGLFHWNSTKQHCTKYFKRVKNITVTIVKVNLELNTSKDWGCIYIESTNSDFK